ncbi:hypothetical protein ACHQM5_003477 [Ranunculus cassubicifolius]
MAKSLIFLIALLVIVSIADASLSGRKLAASAIQCESVFGARPGDSCLSIQQLFNLSAEIFTAINPNLVCNNMFAGQWICTKGHN